MFHVAMSSEKLSAKLMSPSSCEYDNPVNKSIDEILVNSFLMSVAVYKRFNNLKCVGISRNNSCGY